VIKYPVYYTGVYALYMRERKIVKYYILIINQPLSQIFREKYREIYPIVDDDDNYDVTMIRYFFKSRNKFAKDKYIPCPNVRKRNFKK
jgi:hypothetical protein